MTRGLASPQDVVIHAWQVVVYQRVGVDKLHRHGGVVDDAGIGLRQLARRVGEQARMRLPLPSTVAHRDTQGQRRFAGRRQRGAWRVFDSVLAHVTRSATPSGFVTSSIGRVRDVGSKLFNTPRSVCTC